MACGGCKKGGGKRHAGDGGDLSRYAFLSPRQLRHLKSLEKKKEEQINPPKGGKTEAGQD